MPRGNEILSTSPFLYDRQRQKMGVQKKREGDEKTTYTPQTYNRSRDKKLKKKKENHNRSTECFAAVVAEDTGLVYNLRSTDVPRSVTQTTQRIYRGRQTDRRTNSVTTHRDIAGLLNDKGEEAEINPKLTQLENNFFFRFVFYLFC